MKQNTLLKDIERILYTEEEIALAVDRIAKQDYRRLFWQVARFYMYIKGCSGVLQI